MFTVKDAAKRLRRSEKFVRDEIRLGRLHADNSNRNTPRRASIRLRESDIQAYLKRLRG
ncbi:helix-turn-helix domain-containing protein [Hymenobacter lapidiphilus]|uniref:helix-turn-helix domain-containing protein n=1 Tax=Hymenobacter sp. CCM 8763 TaxID=2303334 RepID=UPI003977A915